METAVLLQRHNCGRPDSSSRSYPFPHPNGAAIVFRDLCAFSIQAPDFSCVPGSASPTEAVIVSAGERKRGVKVSYFYSPFPRVTVRAFDGRL